MVLERSYNTEQPDCENSPPSSLRNDGNEGGKKAIDVDKQNNTFARASRFLEHFSAVVARPQRETA